MAATQQKAALCCSATRQRRCYSHRRRQAQRQSPLCLARRQRTPSPPGISSIAQGKMEGPRATSLHFRRISRTGGQRHRIRSVRHARALHGGLRNHSTEICRLVEEARARPRVAAPIRLARSALQTRPRRCCFAHRIGHSARSADQRYASSPPVTSISCCAKFPPPAPPTTTPSSMPSSPTKPSSSPSLDPNTWPCNYFQWLECLCQPPLPIHAYLP